MSHAYGPAVEVPSWIRGLRDPLLASECLSELYGSITHQGTRYSATALCVPFLVAGAADQGVIDRVGVLFLIQFCAIGYSGDRLDWRHQRELQSDKWQQSSWRAVVAEHGCCRSLEMIMKTSLYVTMGGSPTTKRPKPGRPKAKARTGPAAELPGKDP